MGEDFFLEMLYEDRYIRDIDFYDELENEYEIDEWDMEDDEE